MYIIHICTSVPKLKKGKKIKQYKIYFFEQPPLYSQYNLPPTLVAPPIPSLVTRGVPPSVPGVTA